MGRKRREDSMFPLHNKSGEFLRCQRDTHGMTQADVATSLGCSIRTVQRYESQGVQGTIGALRILDIVNAYKIGSIDKLLGWMAQQA